MNELEPRYNNNHFSYYDSKIKHGWGGSSGSPHASSTGGGGCNGEFKINLDLETEEERKRGYPDPERYFRQREECILQENLKELKSEEERLLAIREDEIRTNICLTTVLICALSGIVIFIRAITWVL